MRGVLDFDKGTTRTDGINSEGSRVQVPARSDGGDPCTGDGGYSDIATGTSVTVYDPYGKIVALGALTSGKAYDSYSQGIAHLLACDFQMIAGRARWSGDLQLRDRAPGQADGDRGCSHIRCRHRVARMCADARATPREWTRIGGLMALPLPGGRYVAPLAAPGPVCPCEQGRRRVGGQR